MNEFPDAALQQFDAISPGAHAVTIGNFDGLHRGHQYLLQRLKEHAERLSVRTLVVTFEPHPVTVLRPDAGLKRLMPPEKKVQALQSLGIDNILIVPFDLAFSAVRARTFLDALRVHADPRVVIVGEGFKFGHKREGDETLLREYAAQHDFEVDILQPYGPDGTRIGSSGIRQALVEGRLDDAENALGRRFRLEGAVEHGVARGRDLGFPTANLAILDDLLIPSDGIYSSYVRIDGGSPLASMTYIGQSPTFEPRQRTVEVNILDFHGDIYASNVEIEFVRFIRHDQQFDNPDALIEQIQLDEHMIRTSLEESEPEPDEGAIH